MKRKGTTTDAIEILDRRYDAGRPEREAALQPERVRAAKPRKGLPPGGVSGSAEGFLGPSPLDVLRDLLLLADEEVSLRWLKKRTPAERIELERWAAKMHARASDNPVRVPPRPKCHPPRRGRPLTAAERRAIAQARKPGAVHLLPHEAITARFVRERCPTCGQRTLARVVEDVTLRPGHRVRHLAHLRCAGCGERLFDFAAMERIDKAKPRTATKVEAFRRELDRRTAALDRGEHVDPKAVKRELRARAKTAIAAIRAAASQSGARKLSMRDIDGEIAAARRERTGRSRAARTAGNLAVPPEQLRELLDEAPPAHRQPLLDLGTVSNEFGPWRRKRKARPSGSQPPDKEP